MYKLEYNGHQTAVILGGKYHYRFNSPAEAKKLIDAAEAFSVTYNPGGAARVENTIANRQSLKVVPDGFKYEEL